MSLETEMLDIYIQAEKDVLIGKNVTLRGETMGLEDLDKIRAGRMEWERRISLISNRGRSHSVVSFN